MGLMGRFTMIVKAKANKALDSAEDPRETLDYSYEKQLELLQKVRRGVADVATSKKRLELQAAKLEQSVEKLDGQARRPCSRAARTSPASPSSARRASRCSCRASTPQRAQLQAEQDKLVAAEQRLTPRSSPSASRKETIKAQYTAAEAQTKIGEAFSGVSEDMADVGMAIDRAENKVRRCTPAQAPSTSCSSRVRSTTSAAAATTIDRELAQLSATSGVDAELARHQGRAGHGLRDARPRADRGRRPRHP